MRVDVHDIEETASTNDDVRAAAERGAADGFAVCAKKQARGKGRRGRLWASPEGNLYLSVLFRLSCAAQKAALYSFAAALAAYDTVAETLPDREVKIKWPNDVLVDDAKISGILLEAAPVRDGKIDWLIVGAGINVFSRPEETPYLATCLTEKTDAPVTVERVRDLYLEKLGSWRERLEKEGFEPLRAAWLVAARQGKIVAHLPEGVIEGDMAGLDEEGRLLLNLAGGGQKAVCAADIFFM